MSERHILGARMPDGLDWLLQLIDDGNWHPIGDLAPKLG